MSERGEYSPEREAFEAGKVAHEAEVGKIINDRDAERMLSEGKFEKKANALLELTPTGDLVMDVKALLKAMEIDHSSVNASYKLDTSEGAISYLEDLKKSEQTPAPHESGQRYQRELQSAIDEILRASTVH